MELSAQPSLLGPRTAVRLVVVGAFLSHSNGLPCLLPHSETIEPVICAHVGPTMHISVANAQHESDTPEPDNDELLTLVTAPASGTLVGGCACYGVMTLMKG